MSAAIVVLACFLMCPLVMVVMMWAMGRSAKRNVPDDRGTDDG